MRQDIALLTLGAALGLIGLNSGAAPIEPFATIGRGVNLVSQTHPQVHEQPWYNCGTRDSRNPAQQTWCQKLNQLKNATYQIPGVGLIQLQNGTYTDPNHNLRVVLADQPGTIAFGDLNHDGQEDATVLLGVNFGGSGGFIYLFPVISQANSFNRITPVLLGDRVRVRAVSVGSSQIKVDLFKPGAKDPLCCPTQPVTQFYALRGTKLTPLLNPAATLKHLAVATRI